MVGAAGDRAVGTEGVTPIGAAPTPPPTVPEIAESPTLRIGDMATRGHERGKLLVRDLVTHHAKGRDLDLARRLVGLALRVTHDEATALQRHEVEPSLRSNIGTGEHDAGEQSCCQQKRLARPHGWCRELGWRPERDARPPAAARWRARGRENLPA